MNGVGVFLGPISDGAGGDRRQFEAERKIGPRADPLRPRKMRSGAPARLRPGGETRPRHG